MFSATSASVTLLMLADAAGATLDLKKTSFKKAHEVDLVWDAPLIDAYEASFVTPPVGFW